MLWTISINDLDVKWSTPTLPGTCQRDLRMKQLAVRASDISKKFKTLHMGSNNPMQWCKLKIDPSREAALLKKARGFLGGFKTSPPA